MHRTQIYFEESFFEELKKEANALGMSLSAYIRETLKKNLEATKKEKRALDLSSYAGIWADREIDQAQLREKAWK